MRCLFASMLLLIAASQCFAKNRVEIHFDVPTGMENYNGPQPVTFGVPFEKGTLSAKDSLKIVDEFGNDLPSQFEITATWAKESDDVRWLLVDTIADIREGVAQKAYLEFGEDLVKSPSAPTPLNVQGSDPVTVNTGKGEWVFDRNGGTLGQFILRDGNGREYRAESDDQERKIEVEKSGPVRAVVKISGRFVDDNGNSIADFVTRVRLYAGCEFVRLYHTMIWLTDDKTTIGSLDWETTAADGKAMSAVDGNRIQADSTDALIIRQVDADTVKGTDDGRRWDGWIQKGQDSSEVFAALRWPWQQFPTSASVSDGKMRISLISPEKVMSLAVKDVAVPAVLFNVPAWSLRIFKGGLPMHDVMYDGPEALEHITPRGVAKTWEMLVWREHDNDELKPEIKNIFAQYPVLAFADPAFSVKAALPSPSSPRDPKRFPEVEASIERAFGWFTRERTDEYDFGTWNYGDVQWLWGGSGYPIYRYWMNNGKGWSTLPWVLWLRSGDRRYWENGEANARHCMDVDICHVREWERDPNDFRYRGGQYHYSAIHWGYGPEVFSFYIDSEYLPYCYYMTGYERAKDVMLEHAEQMARFPIYDQYVANFKVDLAKRADRHLYVMVKNLCVLYEATWDERLKKFAQGYLDLIFEAQMPDGNFPGVKSAHYQDDSLNIAIRVFGDERIKPSLKRYHDLLGDPVRGGAKGGINGPMSLWSSVTVYEMTHDPHYLDVAAKVMNAQAASVDAGDSEWRGFAPFTGNISGPTLRGWTVAMSALSKPDVPVDLRAYLPMPGFHARLPVTKDDPNMMRHVALVLNESGDDFEIQGSLTNYSENNHVRVLDPTGRILIDEDFMLTKVTNHNQYEPQAFRKQIQTSDVKGVYSVEVQTGPANSPVSIKSSTGKVVHYMPPGNRTFTAVENQSAGQFFFQPVPREEVRFSFINGTEPIGRTIALDGNGKEIASSRLTGSTEIVMQTGAGVFTPSHPVGEICSFTASSDGNQLYSIVTAAGVAPHYFVTIKGMKPFLSATQEEWFDPTKFPCVDLNTMFGQ